MRPSSAPSCWRASGPASPPRVRETVGAERGDGALRPGVAARRGRLLRDRAPPESHRCGEGGGPSRGAKVLGPRPLCVDKERVTLQALMTALFYDLSPEKEPWIPSQGERRERELRDLIRKGRKPVALFVDEAHDLHPRTLKRLKRLGGG